MGSNAPGTGLHLALFAKPIELGFSERAANASKILGAQWIGDLVQKTEAELLRLPNTGRKTTREIRDHLYRYELRLGMHLPEWTDLQPEEVRASIPGGFKRALSEVESGMPLLGQTSALQEGNAAAKASATVQEEMHEAVSKVCDGRNRAIILSLWGFDGTSRKTLDEVGRAYSMTRERVRQIEARTIRELRNRWHALPNLDAALAAVERNSPLRADDVSQVVRDYGVESAPLSANSLLRACEVFERETPLNISNVTSAPIVGTPEVFRRLQRAKTEIRRASQSYGCTSIRRIHFQLTGSIEPDPELRQGLELFDEVIWLDSSHNWLFSKLPARNRLYNLLEKIFTVTPSIHLTELRQAVSRPHRMKYVPPSDVLAAFCAYFGFAQEVENRISSPRLMSADLGELDGAFVRAFRSLGSPLTREELEDYCVEEEGMKVSSFFQRLSYCPLFLRLAQGVFALVGSHIPPGSVEAAKSRIREERVPPQYGWSSDGEMWFVLRLSRATAHSGTFFVPSFINEHGEGLWALKMTDGTVLGKLEIKQGIANGLRDAFHLLAADAGDYCLTHFNFTQKWATVQIGGADLEDQASDYKNAIAGEEDPDDFDEFDEDADDKHD